VVLARPGQDAALSRFTWSSGDVALPPLGRYLMHAAKVRYHARVRGDGRRLTELRERAGARLDRVTELMGDPAAATAEAAGLAADEAAVAGTLEAVRRMRRGVETARHNQAAVVAEPLPPDAALAGWLDHQLGEDAENLGATLERATRLREILGYTQAGFAPVAVLTPAPLPPETPPSGDGRAEQRLGFGVDVVGYSGRTTPQQAEVQSRVAGMAARVLDAVGLRLADVDRQDGGDGMIVVLPAAIRAHHALPILLNGWRSQVAADNAAHPADRIRLRLSVAGGPFTAAAIGFSGSTIIEMGRLLDCAVLRDAVNDHPEADLVALVSDRIHQDVVGEGYPGLDGAHFERRRVEAKTYRRDGWLWVGPVTASRPHPEPAPRAPSARDVFLINGADDQAGEAVRGLLRALGLRPLGWDEIAARTGEPAPFLPDVLDQAFADNRAAVVLLTPDECAPGAGGRSGAEVMLRAGMAVARQRERTVVIEVGTPPGGLGGLDTVRITADPASQRRDLARIAQRLRNAGCAVDTTGTDWLSTDRFAGLGAFSRVP
ncbi:CATRA conflict system CASPASE/TPR repeat-associated protein, partial [Actinoplanes sp. NPDC026623]|uniref:CATRA conflict system CASPASE/TPR repeat-associated protein n=1 Tax=Actinoplanes sp. NPDC026623 TaxID=3155610 RepID=UPI0033D421F2